MDTAPTLRSCSAQLTLSSPTGATTLVTSAAASSSVRDAWIRLRHTAADGTATAASYRLTIKAPTSLRHLRNDDRASATWVYETFIHYSILDQFAAVLPRDVPINENWTGAIVPDIPGMNWRRGDPGGAIVGPADWNDWVGGESPGHIPEPVAPGHADAAPLVYHWPGTWQVGSEAVGRGRQVAAVTWSKHRGFGRHT